MAAFAEAAGPKMQIWLMEPDRIAFLQPVP